MEQSVEAAPLAFVEGGTVTSAQGFRAGGIHAGFRKNPERLDLALVEARDVCAAAGVFTRNAFCAAPVLLCREHLDGRGWGSARAVAVSSGQANAATGPDGLARAREMAQLAASALWCDASDVLVASTGVIGVPLPLEPLGALPALRDRLSAEPEGGHRAARAIMTTDTHPKECAVRYAAPELGGAQVTVGGIAKGSGMIMPNMATMIAVLTTDAPVRADVLHQALSAAVGGTFNRVTVDGDTSTNDTCVMLASGAAAPQGPFIEPGTPAFSQFQAALDAVCENLARQMAADGEGATRLVTVNVAGARTPAEADQAARTVANSPLVKTAIAGRDANWGRIAAALGRSGAQFAQEDVAIDIMGMPVLRGGLPVPFDEDEALRRFEQPEIVISADLGAGGCRATVWTCDLTHGYVSINGDYRS